MRWGIAFLLVLLLGGGAKEASAEWQRTFRTAVDAKIYSFQQDSIHTDRYLIGTEGGILESKDSGVTWKRTLTVPVNQAVQILQQETELGRWWAVTPHTLYRSVDGGRKWEPAAQFLNELGQIHCFLAADKALYVGGSNGLRISQDDGSSWLEAPIFSGRPLFQISLSPEGEVWAASDRGVYRAAANRGWERIYERVSLSRSREALENEDSPDGFGEESPEQETMEQIPNLFFWFSPDGTLNVIDGLKRVRMDRSNGQSRIIATLSEEVLLPPDGMDGKSDRAAWVTKRGIALSGESSQALQNLSAGWPGSIPRALRYDLASDRLIVITSTGVFHYEHPDLNGYLETRLQSNALKTEALLRQFDNEPQIIELQEAAMRYAEVHPEKIIAWRQAAARRAWLPSLGVGHDLGSDQTVDIDRGGTNDADHFIQGPEEQDQQWSVDVSWDLGDLIWSGDQTTIDNRSKLMVQLRDELLTQLNNLYFSRRRLQVARLVENGKGLQEEIDRNLQIDEYTAGIDALTGGYFSKKLQPTVRFEERTELS